MKMIMFDGTCDYTLWKYKIIVVLVQLEMQGVIDLDYLPEKATESDKKKIEKKVFTSFLMSIYDKILRKVSKETIPMKVFFKLDSLYL